MNDVGRLLSWSSVTTCMALIAAVAFLVLGLIALVSPTTSSTIFGVPVADGPGLAFVQAMGARTIGLALLAIALVILDLKAGLAALLVSAALIAGLDASIVGNQMGLAKAAKHIAYAVVLWGFGFWVASR